MSIKDLEIIRTREDGKNYKTTLGTMEEDAKIQAEKLQKKRARKAKRAKWWKKWKPTIIKSLKIIGILVILGILLYFLFWIVIGGIILMAVGAGMSEGAQASKAQSEFYNEQRIHRSKTPPKYWRK